MGILGVCVDGEERELSSVVSIGTSNPQSSMASLIWLGRISTGLYSTTACSCLSETWTSLMPGAAERTEVMALTQDMQVMPTTGRVIMLDWSLFEGTIFVSMCAVCMCV